MEFKEFPKMARLSRNIIITEKIDGTNACISLTNPLIDEEDGKAIGLAGGFNLRIGSRTKWITPQDDNHGFAAWVVKNMECLGQLGEGIHFGEWWGSGIQRGYGLPKGEKRFSLFNTYRWSDEGTDVRPSCCHVVPVLHTGEFNTEMIDYILLNLKTLGSYVSPGFMKPEGIVVWHTAANIGFKKTIEKDETPKSIANG